MLNKDVRQSETRNYALTVWVNTGFPSARPEIAVTSGKGNTTQVFAPPQITVTHYQKIHMTHPAPPT